MILPLATFNANNRFIINADQIPDNLNNIDIILFAGKPSSWTTKLQHTILRGCEINCDRSGSGKLGSGNTLMFGA